MHKEFADWSNLVNLVREVLTKRHNILRDTGLLGYGEGTLKARLGHSKIPCIA